MLALGTARDILGSDKRGQARVQGPSLEGPSPDTQAQRKRQTTYQPICEALVGILA